MNRFALSMAMICVLLMALSGASGQKKQKAQAKYTIYEPNVLVSDEIVQHWAPPDKGINAVVYYTDWCEECARIAALISKFDDVTLWIVRYDEIHLSERKSSILPMYTETLPRVLIFNGPNKVYDIQGNAAFRIEMSDEDITKAIAALIAGE